MQCTPATLPAAAAAEVEAAVKVEAHEREIKDKAVEAPMSAMVPRPRLPVAMATAPKPSKVITPGAGVSGVARRAIKSPTARRSYAADANDGGSLPMSAPQRRKRLCWR